VKRSRYFVHAAGVFTILVLQLSAGEPTVVNGEPAAIPAQGSVVTGEPRTVNGQRTMPSSSPVSGWTGSPSTIAPYDLYDPTMPSDLTRSNVSTWRSRPPRLQFTLDLLVLDRTGQDSDPLLFDTQTGAVLLNTGDVLDDPEAGLRAGVILMDDSSYDIEFGFLGLDTFENVVTRTSPNPIGFAFFGGLPANPQQSYSVSYESDLASGEINLRRRLGPQVTWLAGFRFLELREQFDILNGQRGFFSETDNDLYGFQLGGEAQLFRLRRSLLFTTVKAGVYYNNADVTAAAASGSGAVLRFIDDEDTAAFVGDFAVGMLIPMGPSADLRIGYQGLFLDGVGLAPDQLDDFSLFTASGTLDESSIYYHGGFIGVDLFW
jgi:hypothetical protein